MFQAKIFTLYPEYFPGPFEIGICKKAFEKKLWDLKLINISENYSISELVDNCLAKNNNKINNILNENNFSSEDCVVIVRTFINKSKKILKLSNEFEINKNLDKEICSHNSYENFYNRQLNELIYNPDNYFYFNGIKLLKLDIIIEFKRNRSEIKDKLFLESYRPRSSFRLFFFYILNNLSLLRYKLLALIIKYSRVLGLYNFLKFFYKKIRLELYL